MAVSYLEHGLNLIGPKAPAEVRARYLDSIGNACLSCHQIEKAIGRLQEAAQIYRDLGWYEDWAREEYNLANACCDSAQNQAPHRWEGAVRHYRNALQMRTKDRNPMRYAATMQNLGTAYRELPAGDRAANVRAALSCYRAAFQVYAGAHLFEKCADLHNNFGNAYACLIDKPERQCRNLRRAIRHFSLALRVRNKTGRPCDYAVTQFNCGQAYMRLISCEPTGTVQLAAECFHEAFDGFRLCGDVPHAEMAQERLASLSRRYPEAGPP
jgi:tetratricopeptide (TPR) repeat protein